VEIRQHPNLHRRKFFPGSPHAPGTAERRTLWCAADGGEMTPENGTRLGALHWPGAQRAHADVNGFASRFRMRPTSSF
jgi:hypothetical protein